MKHLILKLIFPLTIISFTTITKWWYALVVDGPDILLIGFPFPYVCDGWHTSMSLQFFVIEFILDILTHFLFWFAVLFLTNRFVKNINPHIFLTVFLWIITGLVFCGAGFIIINYENLFYVKRPFDIEIMDTGYKFVWQQIERPDYYKYHPEKK